MSMEWFYGLLVLVLIGALIGEKWAEERKRKQRYRR